MSDSCTRHLYLARHAEPGAGDAELSERGARQAVLLGRRLAEVPFPSLRHGPLPRAARTARLVAEQLPPSVQVLEQDSAGDYVPSVPSSEEVDPRWRESVLADFGDVDADEAARGAALGADAIRLLTGPGVGGGDRHELVITHAFTIGWLVAHALDAPAWRWWGLNFCHAGLTVIRYSPDRPPTLVVVNDLSHLPADLRWTGFPASLRP